MSKNVSLTKEARLLIRYQPEVVSLLAAKVGDAYDLTAMFGSSRDVRDNRLYRLRTLPIVALAEWLEGELGDGVPSDWLAWLMEEVTPDE